MSRGTSTPAGLLALRRRLRRPRTRLRGLLRLRRAFLPRLLRRLRPAREERLGRAAEGDRTLLRRAAARLGRLLGGVLDALPLARGARLRPRSGERCEQRHDDAKPSAIHSQPPFPEARGRATSTPRRAARRPRAGWRRRPGRSRVRGRAASAATRRGWTARSRRRRIRQHARVALGPDVAWGPPR